MSILYNGILVPLGAWVLFGILLPVWLLMRRLGYEYSVEISSPSNAKEETGIRRSFLYPKTLIRQPHPSISTLYDLLKFAGTLYPSQQCMGARPILRVHEESKPVYKKVDGEQKMELKTWKYFELGEYEWWTYSQIVTKTMRLGNGLKFLGLEARDKVTLFASTRYVLQI
jgi:long-chain acyl-CoA synthetase